MDKINFQNLPSTETPINADNLNLLQDNIEDAIEELKTLVSELKGNVLWTNPSVTSEFAAQKVDLDLSAYDFIRVIYTDWGGSWSYLDGGKTFKNCLSILNPASNNYRRFTSDDTGVTFEAPANDGHLLSQVPITIIGYKYW